MKKVELEPVNTILQATDCIENKTYENREKEELLKVIGKEAYTNVLDMFERLVKDNNSYPFDRYANDEPLKEEDLEQSMLNAISNSMYYTMSIKDLVDTEVIRELTLRAELNLLDSARDLKRAKKRHTHEVCQHKFITEFIKIAL